MTICLTCTSSFILDPQNAAVILIALAFAVLLVVILLRKKDFSNSTKLGLIYGHLFFLIFPFIFFFYGKTCGRAFYSCGFYKAIIYSLPPTLVFAVLASFLIVPFFFTYSLRRLKVKADHALMHFLEQQAIAHKIKKPLLYLLNRAEPVAFSFSHISPRIFISAGLADILDKKELEAVLLHEIGHLKYRSSLLKMGDSLLRFLSPISAFHVLDRNFLKWLQKEEVKADNFAVDMQGTDRHLLRAKEKINKFFHYKNADGEAVF